MGLVQWSIYLLLPTILNCGSLGAVIADRLRPRT